MESLLRYLSSVASKTKPHLPSSISCFGNFFIRARQLMEAMHVVAAGARKDTHIWKLHKKTEREKWK
jgi:hypothetical protein